MSSSNYRNRPTLKARRNKPYKPYNGPETDEYYAHDNRRGTKRNHPYEDSRNFHSKKICNNPPQTQLTKPPDTSTPRKNTANVRLQNLRRSIQEGTPIKNTPPVRAAPVPVIVINDSPSPQSKKTFANDRLRKLRDELEESKTKPSKSKVLETNQKTSDRHTAQPSSSGCGETQIFQRETQPILSLPDSKHQKVQSSHEKESMSLDEEIVDRSAFTNIWLSNKEYRDSSVIDSKSNDSLLVNVNDTVANFHGIQSMDTSDMEWNASYQNINENPCSTKTEKIEAATAKPKEKNLCIVIDTNIFLSHLQKLRQILNMKVSTPHKPILYLPWMVVQELDYMKDRTPDSRLRENAFSAIKFINEELRYSHSRVVGQTDEEALQQKCIGSGPDDKILACCYQAAEKYENVMLLSNDINLKNKAMINNISACSAHEVLVKVVTKMRRNKNSQKIITKMGLVCSTIISHCAKEAFGSAVSKMDWFSNPPWTLIECLKRFQKYWKTVFYDKLLKQCLKTIDEFLEFLILNAFICDDSHEFEDFINLCKRLCVFLKDIEESRALVDSTIQELTVTK